MTDFERFSKARDDLLDVYLNNIGNYELEKLKRCFESEYKYAVENRPDIDNIISHINKILEARQRF